MESKPDSVFGGNLSLPFRALAKAADNAPFQGCRREDCHPDIVGIGVIPSFHSPNVRGSSLLLLLSPFRKEPPELIGAPCLQRSGLSSFSPVFNILKC